MTCVENKKEIENRVVFNKPFEFIDVEIDEFANYVATIKSNKKYLIWLDYECSLNREILTSIGSLANTLQNGSILLITVNADLKTLNQTNFLNGDEIRELEKKQKHSLQKKYTDDFDPYSGTIEKSDITPKGIGNLFSKTIRAKIDDSMKGRPDDMFHQLFNYSYKDSSTMCTIGGILDSRTKEKDILESVENLDYINSKATPEKIVVPTLTAREKLWLDQKLNKSAKSSPSIPFELDEELIDAYIKYAKHHPYFYEVFMN